MPQHARRHSDKTCAITAEPIKILFELWTRVGPRKDALDGVSDPHVLDRVPGAPCDGTIFGERTYSGMPDDILC